jgi:hypothetical protein
MMWRDAYDIYRTTNDPNLKAAAAALVAGLGGFGMGFTSYPDKAPKSKRRSGGSDPLSYEDENTGGGMSYEDGSTEGGMSYEDGPSGSGMEYAP